MAVADAHKSIGDLPHARHRARGPFRFAGAGRERDRDGGGHRQRDRPPRARIRGRAARPALHAALLDAPCRHDPRRNGAQYSRAGMRVRLGVPRLCRAWRPLRRVAKVQAFVDEVATPRLTRFVVRPLDRDHDGGGRAATLPPSLARRPRRSRCGSPARTTRSPFRSRPKPGISRRPACRPSSAGRARSIRRTSPTNSWMRRSSRPASSSSSGSSWSCRARLGPRRGGSAAERSLRKLKNKRLSAPAGAMLAAPGACGGIPLRANFTGYANRRVRGAGP